VPAPAGGPDHFVRQLRWRAGPRLIRRLNDRSIDGPRPLWSSALAMAAMPQLPDGLLHAANRRAKRRHCPAAFRLAEKVR
jgi:hypothetical protein